jgi:hypothetical protein
LRRAVADPEDEAVVGNDTERDIARRRHHDVALQHRVERGQ